MARGRKAKVNYWKSRGAYGCWIAGNQHILATGPDDAPAGPTYRAAALAFAKLVNLQAGKGTDGYLVSACLTRYRQHLRETATQGDRHASYALAAFAREHQSLSVADLRPHHLTDWLSRSGWNDTTRNNAGTAVMGAIAHAHREGFIVSNPLAGRVKLPAPVCRGREAWMPAELCRLLVDEALTRRGPAFRDLLLALWRTGARPIEIARAEAHNVQGGERIVYRWNARVGYRGKTAKKTRRDRVVYLTPDLQEMVAGLVARYPTGPLFRTATGREWRVGNLCWRWRKLLDRPRVKAFCEGRKIDLATLKPYNFRHTFITDWVESGRSILVCAQLTGTSVAMIERRYGHPSDQHIMSEVRAFAAQRQS